MSNETPAEVLAQKIVDEQPFTDDNDATRIWQLFKNEEMAVEFVALILREADRLSRSLAAGRVSGDVRLWDSQWVRIVNHDNCYHGWTTVDAVAHAIKMTERLIRENVQDNACPPAEPDKSSGIAPIIDMALIVEALEQSDPKAAGYPEPRSRHARALEVARQLLATPPASAPEVTEQVIERVAIAIARRDIAPWFDGPAEEAWPHARESTRDEYRVMARNAIDEFNAALQEKTNAR